MGLLLEEDKLGNGEVADLDTEGRQRRAPYAVAAVWIFHMIRSFLFWF